MSTPSFPLGFWRGVCPVAPSTIASVQRPPCWLLSPGFQDDHSWIPSLILGALLGTEHPAGLPAALILYILHMLLRISSLYWTWPMMLGNFSSQLASRRGFSPITIHFSHLFLLFFCPFYFLSLIFLSLDYLGSDREPMWKSLGWKDLPVHPISL